MARCTPSWGPRVIEYLVMAFFVARPVPPATAAPDAGRPGPTTQGPVAPLRNPVDITASHVAGSGTRGQTVLTGNVVVKHRTLDLRCDKMIAYHNALREVTRAECVGNVRAVDGERTARGEQADFDVPTGLLVVTGHPEAKDPTTHLRGSEVRMTLGSQNFEVKDAVVTLESAPVKVRGTPSRTPVEITSRRVVGSRGQAVFTGDVVVKHRTLDLRCDKMSTFYNGPREVTRGECAGNVRAVDGDRRAKGERARLHVPSRMLVVTGNPEAEDPMIHFRGTQVRMALGGKSFEGDDATVVFKTAPLKEQQQRKDKSGGTKQP